MVCQNVSQTSRLSILHPIFNKHFTIDFVSLNKDFHSFVSLVSTTVSEQLNKEGAVSISDLMNLQPKGTTHTMKDALGDIISSIRWEKELVCIFMN